MTDLGAIATAVLAARPRAIARAISYLEDGHPQAGELLALLFPHTGKAWTIGITGPPGAGKSTLVDRLAEAIRQRGFTLAVVAVDPASPFSGGAILGDRIRMAGLAADPGVYVRSMSNRGHLGGVATATESAIHVLDAAGFDVIVIETVGVGQSEIEIAELADTTVLVQPPHLGDGIQAVKAGIMEVPQVFLLNKADLPGARQAAAEIEGYLDLVSWSAQTWRPPVVLVSATSAEALGVDEACAAMLRHREWLQQDARLATARQVRARRSLWREADRLLQAQLRARVSKSGEESLLDDILSRRLTPEVAARQLIASVWPV
ncbi:MAG: methylmalonyl Co-A mutase-associated GTPase MeaB [Candidatus Sericytochromatia bacterium]|nr:methylmalonyl Co-A mutase-associated GTPase MeaB [Candidatus Sericytochromatia bacterium]